MCTLSKGIAGGRVIQIRIMQNPPAVAIAPGNEAQTPVCTLLEGLRHRLSKKCYRIYFKMLCKFSTQTTLVFRNTHLGSQDRTNKDCHDIFHFQSRQCLYLGW